MKLLYSLFPELANVKLFMDRNGSADAHVLSAVALRLKPIRVPVGAVVIREGDIGRCYFLL